MVSKPMWSLTLLLTLALTPGCEGEIGRLPSEPAPALSPHRTGHRSPPQFSDWSSPVNLGPVVNSASTELEVAISKDGRSLYLASNRAGGIGGFDIWVSQRASVRDAWGPPQNLGPTINTAANDQAPFLTRDGRRLYFFSNRAGGLGGNDLYVARREDKRDDFAWQPPENLGGGVNSAANEGQPVRFDDDETGVTTLYFNSNRPGGPGGTDVYASTLQPDGLFGPAILVSELNTPVRDLPVAIRRDGREMFLASDRDGSLGGTGTFDLWVVTRESTRDAWSTPTNLGDVVNSVTGESRASLSFDGTSLYIVSDRPSGLGSTDIWVSTRSRFRSGHEGDDDEDDDGDDGRRRRGRRH